MNGYRNLTPSSMRASGLSEPRTRALTVCVCVSLRRGVHYLIQISCDSQEELRGHVVRLRREEPPELLDLLLEPALVLLGQGADPDQHVTHKRACAPVVEQRDVPLVPNGVQELPQSARAFRELEPVQLLARHVGAPPRQEAHVLLREVILGKIKRLKASVLKLLDERLSILLAFGIYTVKDRCLAVVPCTRLHVVAVLELSDGPRPHPP
mmetsp:Transcript_31837/g.78063  ORF Transcript_31837/g.78063 Transcript_31837/m.78063 type:complete len:210 (+) Transcript_31837:363-992(+)